ncbi:MULTISPECIES: TnsD family Tn7-like transposition protein [unclassified Variovorax]|uniref:TnsD family Tn7-like transposition protein n=1 Tax=unclassified Variovorax TaxID=663243 RepID=UPI0008BFE883|nr:MULTISPECIES: TnsD family Tn7-like transposition protein [unclassified Variovorax]SEK13024.1 TniQ protein [Variovorax sp. OK202]SFD88059.1 TniQ protein [Variovorax sp. OK212]
MIEFRGDEPSLKTISWLEDETLHSLCTRQHFLSGNVTSSETNSQLFGQSARKITHDFPDAIDTFVERTGGKLGASEEIIRRRTILAAYLPFLSSGQEQIALESMRQSSGRNGVYAKIGLGGERYFKTQCLRFCRECASRDTIQHGTAHWHRDHQLPGVFRCLLHGCELHERSMRDRLRESYLKLPTLSLIDDLEFVPAVTATNQREAEALIKITSFSIKIAHQPAGFKIERAPLLQAYRSRLIGRGWANDSQKHIDWNRATTDLLGFASAIDRHRTHPGWLSSLYARSNLFHQLRARSVRPFFQFVAIAWLFDNWEDFMDCYRIHAAQDPAFHRQQPYFRLPSQRSLDINARKQKFGHLIREGASVSAAAQTVGISNGIGRGWAAALGIEPRLRRNTIPKEYRDRLDSMIRSGEPSEVIALKLSISMSKVREYLRLNPQMHEERKRARALKRLETARANWTYALERSRRGDVGATKVASSDYHYLRKYDVQYATSSVNLNPRVSTRRHKNQHQWAELEELYVQAIRTAAGELRKVDPYREPSRWDIVLRLEHLGPSNELSARILMPRVFAALKHELKPRHLRTDDANPDVAHKPVDPRELN